MPENESSDDEIDLVEELASLKIEMMNQVKYEHDWIRGKGNYNIKCAYHYRNRRICRVLYSLPSVILCILSKSRQ